MLLLDPDSQLDCRGGLVQAGSAVNCAGDPCGQSPLHLAASGGDAFCLLWLLQTGGDANQQFVHQRRADGRGAGVGQRLQRLCQVSGGCEEQPEPERESAGPHRAPGAPQGGAETRRRGQRAGREEEGQGLVKHLAPTARSKSARPVSSPRAFTCEGGANRANRRRLHTASVQTVQQVSRGAGLR
ncbi:ANR37 protein, partial [Atractosteus spatula]|nr:ANR37 protein [Atractosteus spatula]